MAPISATTPDTELVQQLRAGKREALAILYDRYSSLVYSLALKILKQPSEAEDLTQDIFLTFWQEERFDPTCAALSTYLGVMVRSRALNKLRRFSIQEHSLERLRRFIPGERSGTTPLEEASQAEQKTTLKQAMAQLTERQRQILELNFFQGYTHQEIARQLELPLGTVKTNARKGLLELRQRLGDMVK
jgi:RNA polymerase sigma-70 factor (ECF subfamily)